MIYDDNGNLILSDKLGEAVVNNDFEAFTKAQISGKSEDGLTYQDMADFNEFVSEFFRLGEFPSRKGEYDQYTALVLIRKSDHAPFGIRSSWDEAIIYSDIYTYNPDTDSETLIFTPMQPFTIQGYEPAE